MTGSSVRADVVIVSYNSARHLSDAVVPLVGELAVTVVDNASSDGTPETARRLGAEVIANTVNAGFGAAANRGIRTSGAEYVLLLNPDASISSDDVGRLVDRMEQDRSLAVVSPRILRPDGTDQRVRWPLPGPKTAWLTAVGLGRFGSNTSEGFLVGACIVIRRAAFDSVGGFDERFWLYAEETDLMARVQAAGWRIELADDVIAHHLGGASGTEAPDLVLDHFERGAELFVAKHHGRAALLSYRAATLVGAARRAAFSRDAVKRHLQRRRLRRMARVLATRPARVDLDSPATRAPRAGIVVCSLEAWDDIWRRNQFFVRELLALDPDRRVLFVEPPYDWLHERRNPSGRRRQRGLRPLEGDGRIVCFEPAKVWPRVLGPLADRSLRRQVRGAVRQLGFVDPALWVNDPNYAGFATETGWWSVYDITDDWTEAGDGDRSTARVVRNERRLFVECDAVTVCSEGLATTRRRQRPDLVVIPNAVDVEHFRQACPRPADIPGGPIAVYVGTLHDERLDVDLVIEVAEANPDVTVVLVGPNALASASTARLRARPNVRLLGARPYEVVPGYLQHADLLLVPHVVSSFTESLDPIKAYEYLAVGRPALVTPVAGFRHMDGLGGIVVADRREFPERCGEMLGRRERRADVREVDVPAWSDRAREFERLLAGGARRDVSADVPSVAVR